MQATPRQALHPAASRSEGRLLRIAGVFFALASSTAALIVLGALALPAATRDAGIVPTLDTATVESAPSPGR